MLCVLFNYDSVLPDCVFYTYADTGACITSLFKSCDITQSPGIVFGIDAKREYFVQEGNTEHWISFYDDPASGTNKLE